MDPILMALILVAGAPASAAPDPVTETTRQFLTWCDEEMTDCRRYLNQFILGAIKDSTYSNLEKCIPVERNKAADKMLGLMRDPELADSWVGDGLMQSMTDAFPCLTGHK